VKNLIVILILLGIILVPSLPAQNQFESDTIKTKSGDIVISFIGHGTLMLTYNQLVIHVDPVSRYADYSKLPDGDIVLVTHHHGDHLDKTALDQIIKPSTDLLVTETCAKELNSGTVLKNGDSRTVKGIGVEATPAYNIVHKQESGEPFHPRGVGNGYVITLGGVKIYIAGDTENIPEMKKLTGVDIAFLPMNLPYTMTPEMVADAVNMFHPKILYPYHYGNTDYRELMVLLQNNDIKIRIRKMN
jgi:L-ascorbate metabolism protein UlaG (beta-lactamase superfamily)